MGQHLIDGECHVCSGDVDIQLDKNSKAYYACGSCGTRLFMGKKPSDALKQNIKKEVENVVQPEHEEKPAAIIGEPERAATAGAPTITGKPPAARSGVFGSIFGE